MTGRFSQRRREKIFRDIVEGASLRQSETEAVLLEIHCACYV